MSELPVQVSCPRCTGPLAAPSGGEDILRCQTCGWVFVPADAQRAHDYLQQWRTARAYADQQRAIADDAERVAGQWQAAAYGAYRQAMASSPAPGPESAGRPAAVPPQGSATGVPTAALLQGTGAVMILAAVVLVSAVAWTVLPPTGQAVLLAAMVPVLGAVTIATRVRVPTTSAILAALTTAVYAVVGFALPAVVSDLDRRWYPFVVSLIGTAALFVGGALGRVTLWRHLAWASVPVTAVLLAAGVFDWLHPTTGTIAVGAIVVSALAAGQLWLADRRSAFDVETSTTAFWSAVATAIAAAAVTAAAVVQPLVVDAPFDGRERILPALSAFGLSAALFVLGWVCRRSGRGRRTGVTNWWAAMAPLGVSILLTPESMDTQVLALIPATALVIQFLVAGGFLVTRGAAAGWAPVWVWSAGVTVPAWVVVEARGEWRWLALVAIAFVVSAFALTLAARLHRAPLALAGAALGAVTWSWLWAAGHLGAQLEWLTLPLAALFAGVGILAERRLPAISLTPYWRELLLLAAAVPSACAAMVAFAVDGTWQWGRVAFVIVADVVATWLGRQLGAGRTIAVGTTCAEAAGFALIAEHRLGIAEIEPYLAVVAVVVALTLATAFRDGVTSRRWVAPVAAAAIVGLPATLVAIVEPLGGAAGVPAVRAILVVVAWWAIAAAAGRWVPIASCAAVVAAVITWVQVASVIHTWNPGAAIEWYTWSGALTVAVATWFATLPSARRWPTLLTHGPTATLVLVPTALVAWSAGTVNWQVWFVLVASGVALVTGVHYRWAGLVYPALVGIAIVVLPVLTRFASDAPAWIPLAVVGVALVALGARFESLRRRGVTVAHWAATLH